MNKEYILKSESYKKTELVFSNINLVYDAIKEFAYSNYKGSEFRTLFLGKIDIDFRAVTIIGESKFENFIFDINLSELDEKFDFGSFNIRKYISGVKYCYLLKFDQSEILDKVLRYISYEKFGGGYFSKGKFIGADYKDLKFIGISGDVKNENLISSINLDNVYKTMPKLSKENDFYISKFI